MMIIKLFAKIILFPVFLITCFIKTWAKVIARIGSMVLGMIYLLMFIVIAFHFCRQEWTPMLFTIGMSFGLFLVTFCAVAVGVLLDSISDKLSKILTS